MRLSLALLLTTALFCPRALAQNKDVDPDYIFASVFAGAGLSHSSDGAPLQGQVGGAVGMGTLSSTVGHVSGLQLFEFGVMGPLAGRNAPAPFVSYDAGLNLLTGATTRDIPFAVAGYSYVFTQANALNFGIGFDHYFAPNRAVRFEVRDYFTFTQAPTHNVALRVGLHFGAHDP